jgi:hypothetical protein
VRFGNRRFLLTLARDGQVFYITFDKAGCGTLLEHLIDMADDADNVLTWEDIFTAVDAVGAIVAHTPKPPSRMMV